MSRVVNTIDNLLSAIPISDGKIVVELSLPTGVRITLAVLVAILFGIFLTLLRISSGNTWPPLSPLWIVILSVIFAYVVYFLLGLI